MLLDVHDYSVIVFVSESDVNLPAETLLGKISRDAKVHETQSLALELLDKPLVPAGTSVVLFHTLYDFVENLPLRIERQVLRVILEDGHRIIRIRIVCTDRKD